MEGFSLDSSISFMNFWAFTFPLIKQILLTPFDVIQPPIITLTGCFTVGVMQSWCKSSQILLAYFMPSLQNREILVSSLQINLPYCSALQLIWVLAKSELFNLWLRDKVGFFSCNSSMYTKLQHSAPNSPCTQLHIALHHFTLHTPRWFSSVT